MSNFNPTTFSGHFNIPELNTVYIFTVHCTSVMNSYKACTISTMQQSDSLTFNNTFYQ